jgi:hypothetical protein
MIAQKEISINENHLTADSHNPQSLTSDSNKEKWLQKYASRILTIWSQWQTPLGVTCNYTDKIKSDLVSFYDDPLKRLFIEATY